ncbi:M35 family metallo-endopeptidase [Massilia putida]|uniref:M35 family metallo-endopeptidase n=1 Tax=Massilia putida TaxID=1141883 RepID=UPI0009525ADB|nr:M35 family metallo-endopeptidase [Massilia putida]
MNGNARWTGGMLAALLLSGDARAAAPGGIVVDVTPARQNLTRSDDVVVTVTLRNTSHATLYVPTWQTPFAGVQAPLFDVTRDGLPVTYLGIRAKRAAPTPGAPDRADVIALGPGAARSARVELSALYRMDITGAYSVRYRADHLQVVGRPDSARPQGLAEAPQPAAVWIAGRLPRGMPEPSPEARPAGGGLAYAHCSNAQQESIAGAVQAGLAMAQDADAYLQGQALATRYTGWFGPVDNARATTVARHFAALREAFATRPITVDCACTRSWYAYVYPNEPYTIHVCKAFWTAPLTGTDSKGGTLLHEMSHFTVVAGTDDWVYGQAAAAALAGSDPDRAIDNADSHEYFGENNPYRNVRPD